MYKVAAAATLLLLPTLAFAAGFAQQTVFLSRSPVTEGESVLIYAIVTNTASTTFSGKVVVKEGATTIGSVPVSLPVGATETPSVDWQPTAGKHTIVTELQTTDGAVTETRSQVFEINQKPKPAAAGAPPQLAAVESSESIQTQIGSLSPEVASVLAPVFSSIDSVRETIANAANKQIEATKPKIEQSNQGEGSSGWLWSMAYTLYFYILTLVTYVVNSAAIFYPVLAILFLYFMYKMFRRFAR